MTKFNTKKPIGKKLAERKDATVNMEGGLAFKPDTKLELMLRTVSSMVNEKTFYESGKDQNSALKAAISAVAETDPEFIAKLALYARKRMYLRSVPMMLLGELAMSSGKGNVKNARKYVAETISRADELAELPAYVMAENAKRKLYKGKLPMMVKFGVAEAFAKFDAYALSKYNRDGEVTLRDALFLTRPKPKDKAQAKVFDKLAENKLEPADTWEVLISTKGSTTKTWTEARDKMPIMATLRNLRNLLQFNVDIDPVVKKLTDEKIIRNSKQFPYRFYSAYREIEGASSRSSAFDSIIRKKPLTEEKAINESDRRKLLDALSTAMELSIANIPKLEGTTFIASDNSGSMSSGKVSSKSTIRLIDIAALFSAMTLHISEDPIVSVFGEEFATVPCSKRDSILTNMKKIRDTDVGHSTDAWKAIQYLVKNKIDVDRIVIFSDMQCYDNEVRTVQRYPWLTQMDVKVENERSVYANLIAYKKLVNKDVFTYSFDLSSYGTLQIPMDESRVCSLGGWSDNVLRFMDLYERDRTDMLKEIEETTIA